MQLRAKGVEMNVNKLAATVGDCMVRAEHSFLIASLHEAAKTSNEAAIILAQLVELRAELLDATRQVFAQGVNIAAPNETGH